MEINELLLLLTILFSGLMAGLFYAWSISVTPGLARINSRSFLLAFQSMNRAILNPVFFIPFMGTALLLPLLSYLRFGNSKLQFWLILSATAVYLLGIMGITIGGNVPLNNQLEELKVDSMPEEEMQSFRANFEGRWNTLNWIRTFASALTLILLSLALYYS
ncbi:MAG: DUF1772 domain-containing protein [Balneolaceae bacterium]|nr:DUF1772 domain-containing protein [Balneolaceae bacterium]